MKSVHAMGSRTRSSLSGFILATTFLIIFEARLLQPVRWIRNRFVGLGFSAVIYFTLVKLLNVMLAAGILGQALSAPRQAIDRGERRVILSMPEEEERS